MSNLTISGPRSSHQPTLGLAEMVENENRLAGGNNLLLQETADLLRAASNKPDCIYYEPHNDTEFYHPYLDLFDTIKIARMHLDEEFYQWESGSVREAAGPLALSSIQFARYRDEVESIYERLVRTYPEEPRPPLPPVSGKPLSTRPKFTNFRNLFRSSEEVQQELRERREGQNRIIQKVIAYVKSLNDPAIESIVHPSPEESVEKYGSTILGAATIDMVVLVHRKVRPNEEKFQDYIQEWRAKRDQEELAERQRKEFVRLHPEIQHRSTIKIEEETAPRVQPNRNSPPSTSSSKKGARVFFCPSAAQSETQSETCSIGSSAGSSFGELRQEPNRTKMKIAEPPTDSYLAKNSFLGKITTSFAGFFEGIGYTKPPPPESPEEIEFQQEINSFDLSEEIIQKFRDNAPFKEIQALIHHNAEIQILPDHRGNIAKQAALLGKTPELKLILETGPISKEDLIQVLNHAIDRKNLDSVLLLLNSNPIPLRYELYGRAVERAVRQERSDIFLRSPFLRQLLAISAPETPFKKKQLPRREVPFGKTFPQTLKKGDSYGIKH